MAHSSMSNELASLLFLYSYAVLLGSFTNVDQYVLDPFFLRMRHGFNNSFGESEQLSSYEIESCEPSALQLIGKVRASSPVSLVAYPPHKLHLTKGQDFTHTLQ